MTTDSNNTSWPYHLYTGNDPKKQGSYVKCKNNPCVIHGGTDIIATSPEDAYEKAYHSALSILGISRKTTSDNPPDVNNAISNVRINNADEKITLRRKHSADWEAVHNPRDEDEKTMIKDRDDFLRKQGLYVYDSPLFHRIDGNTTTYELAAQVFPECRMANDARTASEIIENSNDIHAHMNRNQKKAFEEYSGDSYEDINSYLRNGNDGYYDEDEIKEIKSSITRMNNVMKETETVLTHDTVFFRKRFCPEGEPDDRSGEEKSYYKAVASSANKNNHNNSYDDKNVNNPIVSRANYMSTALSYDDYGRELHDSVQYIIKAPAGTRGLALNNSEYPDENEFLIDKGYDLKVIGIYETGDMAPSDYYTCDSKVHVDKYVFNKQPIIALEIVPKK